MRSIAGSARAHRSVACLSFGVSGSSSRVYCGSSTIGAVATVVAMADAAEIPKARAVSKVFLNKEQAEGAGARVRRSIGRPELSVFDPFLLLDCAEDFIPLDATTPPSGFPAHPHRGFETVSYVLEGAMQHQDFKGHEGIIRAGDLQWMTAGRGIVHSEMPAARGKLRGLQLWVNLPAKDKMIEPQYQELQASEIPNVEEGGVKVKIIAGESFGVKSPVFTRTPTMYLDFTMQPGAELHQLVSQGWNAFAYILDGDCTFESSKGKAVSAHHTALFGPGEVINVWNNSEKECRFLLIAGQPLNEPLARHGPFVMNTQEEIRQTIRDYQKAENGFESLLTWKEKPVYLI